MADSNGNGEVGVEILNRDPDPALEENSDDNNGAAELVSVVHVVIIYYLRV